jgi:hypothetical protein
MNAVPDLSGLPFPVAYPLYWAHDPAGSLGVPERRANAIFSCYQAMRLATLLMLSDYLDVKETDPELASRIRGLRVPHWQEWTLLADELARFWSSDDRRPRPRFRKVVEGWVSVSRVKRSKRGKTPPLDATWQALIDHFPGVGGKAQAGNANEAVWELRNRRAHREGVITPDTIREQRDELDRLVPLVHTIIMSLFGTPEFELLRSVSAADGGVNVIRLCGPHPDLQFAAEEVEPAWVDALAATLVAARFPEEVIPVYPLLIPTDDPDSRASIGLLDPAVMIDGVTDGKLTVLGVLSGATLQGPHLQATLAALRRKQADLFVERRSASPWTLAPWARMTTIQALEDLAGRKYFPAFYLARPDVDGAVDRYESLSGRALLLLGEAGSGKSSLIARLADRLTGGQETGEHSAASLVAERGDETEDLVVFLAGRADYGGSASASADRLLVDAMARKLGVREGDFANLGDLVLHLGQEGRSDTVHARRFWLLLDGVNEADRFVDLVRALDVFLPVLGQAPRVRLVVSMRSGAFHSLSARDATLGAHSSSVFANADRFVGFPDARGQEQPWLEIRPFHMGDEGPRAYELRREKLPGRAANIPYELLSRPLKELMLTPLYLHLFHETFADRVDVPGDLDDGQLLDAYLDRLASSPQDGIAGADTWLDRLASVMVGQRRAFLPITEADAWTEEWRKANGYSSLQATTKLDPVEELVAASVLLRPAESGSGLSRELAGYQFTQQKLAERLLLRHLDRKLHDAGRSVPTRADLVHWIEVTAAEPPFAELTGALAEWVVRLTRSNVPDVPARLDALLEIDNDVVRSRLMGPLITASAAAAPDAATAILVHLAKTAAGRPDGRARFLLTASRAVERLMVTTPLAASERALHAFVLFCNSLSARDPGDLKASGDLLVSLTILGNMQVAQGDPAGALKSFRDSLAIAERLAKAEPKLTPSPGWLHVRDPWWSLIRTGHVRITQGGYLWEGLVIHANLASAFLQLGDRAAAMTEQRKGREIVDELVRLTPHFERWKRKLAWFDGHIARRE